MTTKRSRKITAGFSFLLYFLLLFIGTLVGTGQSLVCFTCEQATCHNQSLWQRVPDCEKGYTDPEITGVCLKLVYTLPDKSEKTQRACAPAKYLPGKSPNYTYDCGIYTHTKPTHCKACNDKDECNSASGYSSYLGAFSFSFVLLFFYVV